MYPVASTNEQDLVNLMDVYLDAVLHPAIYRRPRIFEQEGWHLRAATGRARTQRLCAQRRRVQRDERRALRARAVLYDGAVRRCSPTPLPLRVRRRPGAIPTLTYEGFLETHRRHYALPNSYTVLYGDLDIDRELAFIDERFRNAAERDAGEPNPLALQAPVAPAPARVAMATRGRQRLRRRELRHWQCRRPRRACSPSTCCWTPSAAPTRPRSSDACMDAGLADDVQATLLDGMLQPQAMFQLKGTRPGAAEKFRALRRGDLRRACRERASRRDKLSAALAQAEFNLREGDWGGYPDGVALSMCAMSGWLYDDERPARLPPLRGRPRHAHGRPGQGPLRAGPARAGLPEPRTRPRSTSCHDEAGDAAEETAELEARRAHHGRRGARRHSRRGRGPACRAGGPGLAGGARHAAPAHAWRNRRGPRARA